MIYFVRLGSRGPVKIGTTIRLSVRLAQLRHEHGPDLRVLAVGDGSFPEEKALHRRFGHLRRGGEWFEPGRDLLRYIAEEGRRWDGADEVPPVYKRGIRIESDVLGLATMAAGLMKMSLSDYASMMILEAAAVDIPREARKLIKELTRDSSEPTP